MSDDQPTEAVTEPVDDAPEDVAPTVVALPPDPDDTGQVPEDLERVVAEKLPVLSNKAAKDAEKQKEPMLKQLLMFLPRMVKFLVAVARSPNVSTGWKAQCVFVIAYVFSPCDLIPDFIPILGLLDDLYLVLLTVDQLLNHLPEDVFEKCWTWDRKVLDTVRKTLDDVSNWLPNATWRILETFFGESRARR